MLWYVTIVLGIGSFELRDCALKCLWFINHLTDWHNPTTHVENLENLSKRAKQSDSDSHFNVKVFSVYDIHFRGMLQCISFNFLCNYGKGVAGASLKGYDLKLDHVEGRDDEGMNDNPRI